MIYLFAYTCCLTIALPLFFPSWHLLFFAPFLVFTYYRYSLISCLWWALASGFVIDLFSAQTRLGIYAIHYSFTTFCLYRYKFYFFEDRFSTLPIMTFLFASLSILIQFIVFYVLGHFFSFSWEWAKNTFIFFPFQNALYATLFFTLPFQMGVLIKKRYDLFKLSQRRRI